MIRIFKATLVLSLILALALCGSAYAEAAFSGGSGTQEDPYLISSAKDLREMAELVNSDETGGEYNSAFYLLTADIDVSGKKWIPIGYVSQEDYFRFEGVFDGGGHTISGISIDYKDPLLGQPHTEFGLFGQVQGSAVIRNVTVTASEIKAYGEGMLDVGAIAGELRQNAVIENCAVTDSVSLESSYRAAGICGSMAGDSAVSGCSSAAAVLAKNSAAGIACVGRLISNCVNSGNVVALEGDAAGIATEANGSVTGCVNSGNISAPMDRLTVDKAGGIVCSFGDGALNSSMNDASVQLASCTNSGAVSGAYAGGIAVNCYTGSIRDCVNTGEVTAREEAGGILAFFQPSAFGTPCESFSVIGCSNSAAVTSKQNVYAGGICGMIYGCPTSLSFENCSNSGTVTAEGEKDIVMPLARSGGIIGSSHAAVLSLTGCSNSGPVSGMGEAGGLVGSAEPMQDAESSAFSCVDCVNSGSVYAVNPGGLTQYIYAGGMAGKCGSENKDGELELLYDEFTVENFINSGSVAGDDNGPRLRTDSITYAYGA